MPSVRRRSHPGKGDPKVSIPAQIFFDPRLLTSRITTPHVYAALVAAEESSRGTTTYGRVAKLLDMTPAALGHHLRWLRDHGYLEAEWGTIQMTHKVKVTRFPPPLSD